MDIVALIAEIVFGVWLITLPGQIYLLKKYIAGRVGHDFDVMLKQFEHDLGLKTEAAKFDFQRLTIDFGKFSQRKHETYQVLYEKAFEGVGLATVLVGKFGGPNEEMSDAEIDVFLELRAFPKLWADEIARVRAEGDRSAIYKKLVHYDRQKDLLDADKARWELKNYASRNALFMSETVAAVVDRLVKSLVEYLYAIGYGDNEQWRRFIDLGKDRAPKELLSNLKTEMKRELGIGDYEFDDEREERPVPGAGAPRREQ